MAKRGKVKSLHTSLRLHPDVSDRLAAAADATGWSVARTVGHLVNIAFAVLGGDHKPLSEHVATFQGAKRIRLVELENARRLAAARKEIRTPAAGRGSRPGTTAAARAARRPADVPTAAAKPGAAA